MNLKDFAATEEKQQVKKSRCFTCNLPPEILDQIHEARIPDENGKRVSFPMISRWLKSEGHDIGHMTIRNHFIAEHDHA